MKTKVLQDVMLCQIVITEQHSGKLAESLGSSKNASLITLLMEVTISSKTSVTN